MIRHVIALKMSATDPAQRREDAHIVAGHLRSLEGRIPDLLSVVVGVDSGELENHWDVTLISEHPTFEALAAYQVHPNHLAVVEKIGPYIGARAVVDFELPAE